MSGRSIYLGDKSSARKRLKTEGGMGISQSEKEADSGEKLDYWEGNLCRKGLKPKRNKRRGVLEVEKGAWKKEGGKSEMTPGKTPKQWIKRNGCEQRSSNGNLRKRIIVDG